MANQMLNLLKTTNHKAANGQPINIVWKITVAGVATLTSATKRMKTAIARVVTINRVYRHLVLRSLKWRQIWWVKNRICRLQCKIKASSSCNNSQRTSSKGDPNSLTRIAIHSLSNSIITKTNKSISIKARLIRPLVTSLPMQFHIHNTNYKPLFSNLTRNRLNKFSRGNSATAMISSNKTL